MSNETVVQFVHRLLQEDDSLSGPNDCRNVVSRLQHKLNERFPGTNAEVIVYPEAKKGKGVHYSLLVGEDDNKILINTVAAPGFPEYVGEINAAVPTYSAMKVTPKVI
jgi:uncharacterized protein YigA (DUF484 family)